MTFFEQERTIRWQHIDASGTLRLATLAGFFEETAAAHIDALGVGFDLLKERGEVWVLSRMYMRLLRSPRWGDTVTVRTWATGVDRLFANRDFSLFDSEGRLAGASSAWLLIDMHKRRPKRLDQMMEQYTFEPSLHAVDRVPNAIEAPQSYDHEMKRTVSYSDIDMNGHMNNARYIEWAFDAVDHPHAAQAIEINYLSEISRNDTAIIRSARTAEHAHHVEAVSGEKPVFRAVIEYRSA